MIELDDLRNIHPRPSYETEKRWEMESRVDRLEREVKGLNKAVFWLAVVFIAYAAIQAVLEVSL